MKKDIFYTHPNSQAITKETYTIVLHDGIAYVVILGQSACTLWNSDRARDLIFNEIIRRELRLVAVPDIRLIVSLGELVQGKTLLFQPFWKDKLQGVVYTDFEERQVPSVELLEIFKANV